MEPLDATINFGAFIRSHPVAYCVYEQDHTAS